MMNLVSEERARWVGARMEGMSPRLLLSVALASIESGLANANATGVGKCSASGVSRKLECVENVKIGVAQF
jgi:hypothetical protein